MENSTNLEFQESIFHLENLRTKIENLLLSPGNEKFSHGSYERQNLL